jgi:tRNA(Arg) A34 adenosine deaminase TadA
MDVTDHEHLVRAVELAEEALAGGNDPFGTLLVSAEGEVLFEARNETAAGDATQHPELMVAQWAAKHLSPEARRTAVVYTSGEHCPMCSAAHGWVGLGKIVYASSSEQLGGWLAGFGLPPTPVNILPIKALVPGIDVDGPDLSLADRVLAMHKKNLGR